MGILVTHSISLRCVKHSFNYEVSKLFIDNLRYKSLLLLLATS